MTHSQTVQPTSPSPSSPPPAEDLPASRVTAPPLGVTGTVANNAGDRWEIPSPTTPESDDAGYSAGELPPDPLQGESSGTRSSEGEVKVSGLNLKDLARGLVLAITARIAASVARDDTEAASLLVATEKEQSAIADPLAKIGGRHVKATAASPDVADLIMAGIAAAGYAFRAATGWWNLKRHRAAVQAATGDPVETADVTS